MNICKHIQRGSRYWPDRPAVICGSRVVTYAQLEERSNRLANALLGLGLVKGDRVAIQALNCAQIVEIETALLKAGLVKTALNARFTATETSDAIANAAPAAILLGHGFTEYDRSTPGFESLRHFIAINGAPGMLFYEDLLVQGSDSVPEVQISADDLAVLHFSSGSTGKIKAAMQTYRNRLACLRKMLAHTGARSGDRVALMGPITHASGMLMQPFLHAGGTLHIYERFDPTLWLSAVGESAITHSLMVPAMINTLLAEPGLSTANLSSLRSLTYGAAPMAPVRIAEAWERIGPVLAQVYGASESTSLVTSLTIDDHAQAMRDAPTRLASCGRPYGETEVRVLTQTGHEVKGDEIGEIVIRGDDVFQGYWGAPELTAETLVDGWLHTGDLARVDSNGFIYIVDRKKDMVVSGGFNVYPSEVEAVLYQHPAVFEVCVVGVPDDKWGEAVKAVVVLKPNASIESSDLVDFCRGQVAGYKLPRSVDLVPALPKNASGKLARKEVRSPYWVGRDRNVN